MPDTTDRKPIPTKRASAQELLNSFLKDNNILIGTSRPNIDFTNNGSMIINSPQIIAVYADEVNREPQPKAVAQA